METYLQPREVVLDFGLLPLQVLCPQLDTVAGVLAAHRGLSALATTAGDGKKYVSCSSVATALELPEQQCRLLLETLAAVSSSGGGGGRGGQQQQPPPAASGDLACLHELSLFLLAQIYGRESHRPETQDHWPDASTSSGGQLEPQLKAASRQPGSPSASSNSRLLIKAQLQALQRQHASYACGYAEFLERHSRVLLELILDDSSSIEEWRQQRAAHVAQQKAAAGQLQQQQQQPLTAAAAQQRQQQQLDTPMAQPAPPAGDDSEMTPVDEDGAAAAASSAMDVQQPGGDDAASGMQLSPRAGKAAEAAAGSMFGAGAQQQQQQHTQVARPGSSIALAPADKAGSLGSSGSLVSLGGSSLAYPPVSITAAEFNRLGFLLEAFRVSKATLAAILESSAAAASSTSGGGGGALGSGGGGPLGGASSRSLFSELRVSGAAAGGGAGEAGSSSSAGGGDGCRALSAYVPGYATAGSLSMEEVGTWMAASWLHKMQQAAAQQHKAAAAAAATAAVGASPTLGAVGVLGGGVSPLLQQPAFGSTPAAPAGPAQPQQPQAGSSSGVASMLAEMSAASGGSSAVAGWLGMAGSPPNSNSQQLSVLASPGGLAASGPAAAGSSGFGSFIGGINGLPVVTSVSTGGPSPLTAHQQQQAAAAGATPPPGGAGSPAAGFGFVAATPGSGTPGAAGGSPAAPAPALGVGSLLSAGPGQGLNSIRVNTTKGMVAVAGGCVDDCHVTGVYRGTVVRGPADAAGDCITIQDCSEAHVYILAPVKLARIVNCNDCNICIGAVSTLLRIERCERLQLTAAAGQVLVVSCHSCCLHLGTPRMPAILGDCRFVKLAPYNTRYEALYQHLAAAGLSPGKPSLWDVPLIITTAGGSGHSNSGAGGSSCGGGSSRGGSSCGGGAGSQHCSDAAAAVAQRRPGAATPSSPHTLGSSSSAERRGGAAPPKPVLLMPPEEFFPLVVPFRGTAGPLAGGAAHHASTHWQPNSHRNTQGPLPPFPFPLPPEYDAALQQQYGVVTELRSKIKGSGLDEPRRAQLQNVIQSYFREWLHNSGAIRQVYDLSKLEGDEYGLTGGSPTAALRDTHSL